MANMSGGETMMNLYVKQLFTIYHIKVVVLEQLKFNMSHLECIRPCKKKNNKSRYKNKDIRP